MEMYAIIYGPTGVPVGLYVDKENAIKRCKFLSSSKDFIVSKVSVTELKTIKFTREVQED